MCNVKYKNINMIALILIFSIPITNLLSNIVAAWLEPQLKSRKKFIFFLFVVFSFIGGFFLYYFNISDEIKEFVERNTTVNSINDDEITYDKDISKVAEPLTYLSSNATLNSDDVIYGNDTIRMVQYPSKGVLSNTIKINNKIEPQRLLALKQPIGIKIIGWLLILALPVLIILSCRYWFLSSKNFSIASSYHYTAWEWFWGTNAYNQVQNDFYKEIGVKYETIGWCCFIFFCSLIPFLILSYKAFTPSLYAVEILKGFYDFLTFLGESILIFFKELISPLFY